MTNPLHAAYYADSARFVPTRIVENVRLATDTFRVRLECPAIAQTIRPGQFVMVRLADCNDPLLGRPLALYDTFDDADGRPVGIDVVYLVAGKLTSRLAQCRPGAAMEVWGPLGNGFSSQPCEHLILVAGGIGQTPFLAVSKQRLGRRCYSQQPEPSLPPRRLTFCYGARSKDYFAGLEDFRALGVELRLSTDDGSLGHHGFVTDILRQTLGDSAAGSRRILCCGPEPMMEAVAEIAAEHGVPCEVSLETPMACGIGICFTCVAKVWQSDGTWDYKRTCVEGPVFSAEKICW